MGILINRELTSVGTSPVLKELFSAIKQQLLSLFPDYNRSLHDRSPTHDLYCRVVNAGTIPSLLSCLDQATGIFADRSADIHLWSQKLMINKENSNISDDLIHKLQIFCVQRLQTMKGTIDTKDSLQMDAIQVILKIIEKSPTTADMDTALSLMVRTGMIDEETKDLLMQSDAQQTDTIAETSFFEQLGRNESVFQYFLPFVQDNLIQDGYDNHTITMLMNVITTSIAAKYNLSDAQRIMNQDSFWNKVEATLEIAGRLLQTSTDTIKGDNQKDSTTNSGSGYEQPTASTPATGGLSGTTAVILLASLTNLLSSCGIIGPGARKVPTSMIDGKALVIQKIQAYTDGLNIDQKTSLRRLQAQLGEGKSGQINYVRKPKSNNAPLDPTISLTAEQVTAKYKSLQQSFQKNLDSLQTGIESTPNEIEPLGAAAMAGQSYGIASAKMSGRMQAMYDAITRGNALQAQLINQIQEQIQQMITLRGQISGLDVQARKEVFVAIAQSQGVQPLTSGVVLDVLSTVSRSQLQDYASDTTHPHHEFARRVVDHIHQTIYQQDTSRTYEQGMNTYLYLFAIREHQARWISEYNSSNPIVKNEIDPKLNELLVSNVFFRQAYKSRENISPTLQTIQSIINTNLEKNRSGISPELQEQMKNLLTTLAGDENIAIDQAAIGDELLFFSQLQVTDDQFGTAVKQYIAVLRILMSYSSLHQQLKRSVENMDDNTMSQILLRDIIPLIISIPTGMIAGGVLRYALVRYIVMSARLAQAGGVIVGFGIGGHTGGEATKYLLENLSGHELGTTIFELSEKGELTDEDVTEFVAQGLAMGLFSYTIGLAGGKIRTILQKTAYGKSLIQLVDIVKSTDPKHSYFKQFAIKRLDEIGEEGLEAVTGKGHPLLEAMVTLFNSLDGGGPVDSKTIQTLSAKFGGRDTYRQHDMLYDLHDLMTNDALSAQQHEMVLSIYTALKTIADANPYSHDVIEKNYDLKDDQRRIEADKMLGITMSDKQFAALMKAHHQKKIFDKMRSLEKHFDKKQMSDLLQSGFAGTKKQMNKSEFIISFEKEHEVTLSPEQKKIIIKALGATKIEEQLQIIQTAGLGHIEELLIKQWQVFDNPEKIEGDTSIDVKNISIEDISTKNLSERGLFHKKRKQLQKKIDVFISSNQHNEVMPLVEELFSFLLVGEKEKFCSENLITSTLAGEIVRGVKQEYIYHLCRKYGMSDMFIKSLTDVIPLYQDQKIIEFSMDYYFKQDYNNIENVDKYISSFLSWEAICQKIAKILDNKLGVDYSSFFSYINRLRQTMKREDFIMICQKYSIDIERFEKQYPLQTDEKIKNDNIYSHAINLLLTKQYTELIDFLYTSLSVLSSFSNKQKIHIIRVITENSRNFSVDNYRKIDLIFEILFSGEFDVRNLLNEALIASMIKNDPINFNSYYLPALQKGLKEQEQPLSQGEFIDFVEKLGMSFSQKNQGEIEPVIMLLASHTGITIDALEEILNLGFSKRLSASKEGVRKKIDNNVYNAFVSDYREGMKVLLNTDIKEIYKFFTYISSLNKDEVIAELKHPKKKIMEDILLSPKMLSSKHPLYGHMCINYVFVCQNTISADEFLFCVRQLYATNRQFFEKCYDELLFPLMQRYAKQNKISKGGRPHSVSDKIFEQIASGDRLPINELARICHWK